MWVNNSDLTVTALELEGLFQQTRPQVVPAAWRLQKAPYLQACLGCLGQKLMGPSRKIGRIGDFDGICQSDMFMAYF